MNTLLALLLAGQVAVTGPGSPSHLEPCMPALLVPTTELLIHSRVYSSLRLGLTSAPRDLIFLVEPSFGPEYAVTLTIPSSGDAVLIAAKASSQLYAANQITLQVPGVPNAFEYGIRPTPAAIPVSTVQRTLSRPVADLLVAVVGSATKAARYPARGRITLDGTAFTFLFSEVGAGTFCGTAQSPDASSVQGRLVAIGEQLFRFARDPAITEASLERALQARR